MTPLGALCAWLGRARRYGRLACSHQSTGAPKAGLQIQDIDVVESEDAFAAQDYSDAARGP